MELLADLLKGRFNLEPRRPKRAGDRLRDDPLNLDALSVDCARMLEMISLERDLTEDTELDRDWDDILSSLDISHETFKTCCRSQRTVVRVD